MDRDKYYRLLQDPRWQRKKTEILTRDDFTCQCCGCKDKTLHVHHLKYQNNLNPWEYDNDDLITLCEDCHHKTHEEINKAKMKDVFVGGIYQYDHGDYTNTMLCYDIDYVRKEIYLMGIDDGASWNELWIDMESYRRFTKKFIPLRDENQCENNGIFDILVSCVYTLLNKPQKIHFEYLSKINKSPSGTLKNNLQAILLNNDNFNELYKKYEKGLSQTYCTD